MLDTAVLANHYGQSTLLGYWMLIIFYRF